MSSYQSYQNGMEQDGYGQQQQQQQQQRAGGFQSSPAARGGGFQTSPGAAASGEKKQRREGQSLTPLTIRQCQECEVRDTKFKCDGKELAPITIVGCVVQVDIKATNINYTVDDGTGIINVRIYIDQGDDASKNSVITEQSYIRVYGNLRLLGDQRNIVAYQATALKDYNELSYHMLEALYTHLLNTKGIKTATGEGVTPGFSQQQQHHQPGQHDVSMTSTSSSHMPSSSTTAPAGDFTPVQYQVLRVFEQDSASGDSGTSIQTVMSQLSHISQRDIEQAIEFLSNEGHLYSTIDEHHFKSTAAS